MTHPNQSSAQKLAYWRAHREAEIRKAEPEIHVLLASEVAIDLYRHLSGEGE